MSDSHGAVIVVTHLSKRTEAVHVEPSDCPRCHRADQWMFAARLVVILIVIGLGAVFTLRQCRSPASETPSPVLSRVGLSLDAPFYSLQDFPAGDGAISHDDVPAGDPWLSISVAGGPADSLSDSAMIAGQTPRAPQHGFTHAVWFSLPPVDPLPFVLGEFVSAHQFSLSGWIFGWGIGCTEIPNAGLTEIPAERGPGHVQSTAI